jgi:hypothetical protein
LKYKCQQHLRVQYDQKIFPKFVYSNSTNLMFTESFYRRNLHVCTHYNNCS